MKRKFCFLFISLLFVQWFFITFCVRNAQVKKKKQHQNSCKQKRMRKVFSFYFCFVYCFFVFCVNWFYWVYFEESSPEMRGVKILLCCYAIHYNFYLLFFFFFFCYSLFL
eukprot:PhF_6_TR12248/c2_g1_i1/m.19398